MANRPQTTVGFDFSEVRELLDGKRLSKTFKVELGTLATTIDATIRHRVVQVYRVDQDKLRASSNIAGKASLEASGTTALKASILYKHQVTGLASYFKNGDTYWGNLGLAVPDPKRKGRIHRVEILRGKKVVSTGRVGRGGFLLKSESSRRFFVERKTRSRSLKDNLNFLLGMSPSMMVASLLNKDAKLQQQISVATDEVMEKVLNYYYGKK